MSREVDCMRIRETRNSFWKDLTMFSKGDEKKGRTMEVVNPSFAAKCDPQGCFYDNIGESARNRFGRPYISGRPLLSCDRLRIIQMFQAGIRKIEIARTLGVTHSCVSKVIRRYEQTGAVDVTKHSRTASCACPGESPHHNPFICRHLKYSLTPTDCSKKSQLLDEKKPKVFTIEWILSDFKTSSIKQTSTTTP